MRTVHTPTCIQLRGYIYEELDQAQANSELEQLISILGAERIHQDEDSVIARKAVDEVYEVYLKLVSGHDYCVFQAWATPISDDHCAPFDQVREIVEHWLPAQLRREVLKGITPLFEVSVYACQEAISRDEMTSLFSGESNLVHSLVYSSKLQLIAQNAERRDTYLVAPVDDMVSNQMISILVDDISRMEIYYNKVISFYEVYTGIYERLSKIEEDVMGQMDEIAAKLGDADTASLKAWLTHIGEEYGRISIISKGLRQDTLSLRSNVNNIKATLRAWDEARVRNHPPISDLPINDSEMVGGAYESLSERIRGIQQQLGNMIAMVRTRIELGQQEQSLQQLTDLVNTEKSMDMLEFVFLAAVLLEISGFVFAALGEVWGGQGLPGMGLQYVATNVWRYPTLLTALFIPLVLILSYFIIRLTDRLIK